jgi:hypothetical protein
MARLVAKPSFIGLRKGCASLARDIKVNLSLAAHRRQQKVGGQRPLNASRESGALITLHAASLFIHWPGRYTDRS